MYSVDQSPVNQPAIRNYHTAKLIWRSSRFALKNFSSRNINLRTFTCYPKTCWIMVCIFLTLGARGYDNVPEDTRDPTISESTSDGSRGFKCKVIAPKVDHFTILLARCEKTWEMFFVIPHFLAPHLMSAFGLLLLKRLWFCHHDSFQAVVICAGLVRTHLLGFAWSFCASFGNLTKWIV